MVHILMGECSNSMPYPHEYAHPHPHTHTHMHTRTCTHTCTHTQLKHPSKLPFKWMKVCQHLLMHYFFTDTFITVVIAAWVFNLYGEVHFTCMEMGD